MLIEDNFRRTYALSGIYGTGDKLLPVKVRILTPGFKLRS